MSGRRFGRKSAALALCLLTSGWARAGESANWGGKYFPCDRHADLLSRDHLELGLRIATRDSALARQFEHAMEFWSGIIDMNWHEVESQECSVELVEGARNLFETQGIAARAQEPDRAAFQGWVAFNPASKLTEHEMFVISVHEIGHLLGLPHNPSGASVMFFFNLDDSVWLDSADLTALAARHTLRSGVFARGPVAATRVVTP